MRMSSLLISAALGLSSQAQAIELFHEDFEVQPTSTFAVNTSDLGGTAGTVGDNQWIINNEYAGGSGTLICLGFPFSFSVPNTPTQPAAIPGNPTSHYLHTTASAAVANGVSNATYIPADGTCVLAASHFARMTGDVSTLGMNNVALDFWWILGGTNSSYGEVYYSLDSGANWTQITTPFASYLDQPAWTQTVLSMPEWDNQPALRFAFRFVNNVSATATDPGFGIDEVRIVADPINNLPVAADDAYQIGPEGSLDVDVSVNDVPSADGGNVWALVAPPSGALDLAANGNLLYAADAGFAGDVIFDYSLCDVDNDCDEATVTITVMPAVIFSDDFE